MRAHHSRGNGSIIEALEGRRHMDAVLFEGYLGHGNSPVLLTVTEGVDAGSTTATVQLPSGKVLYPTDPTRFGLLKAAVPPNPI